MNTSFAPIVPAPCTRPTTLLPLRPLQRLFLESLHNDFVWLIMPPRAAAQPPISPSDARPRVAR